MWARAARCRQDCGGSAGAASSSEEDAGSSTGSGSDSDMDLAEKIDRLLGAPLRFSVRIIRTYRKSADTETSSGARAVSLNGWTSVSHRLAEEFDLPYDLFSNSEQLFERFDFDGDHLLERYEVVKLVKYVLRQRRKELGERQLDNIVPQSTLRYEGYTIVRELGRGGQGAMYLCTKSSTSHQYCVKFYNKNDANAGGVAELIDEYELMKKLKSSYIAQTYKVFQDRDFYYLVNEPYFGGDLTKLAKKAHDQGIQMTEAWWRGIFKQCLLGLEYLHRKAIMHCDIKEPNIMIANGDDYQAPQPVLIDFGLSEPFSRREAGVSGTPGYIPPETWQMGHWYPVGDIYSLGITFFQLMIGSVPSATGSVLGVLQPAPDANLLRQAGMYPQLPWQRFPESMPALQELVHSMTTPTRQARPRAPTCLSHRWFLSKSDAKLPVTTLQGLLGSSAVQAGGEEVVNQLMNDNNLDELRRLRAKFSDDDDMQRRDGEASPGTRRRIGRLGDLLHKNGIGGGDGTPARARMRKLLDEAIWMKRHYSDHYIADLFRSLDTDDDRRLSVGELSALFDSDSFECPFSDIQELVDSMGPFDKDGCVSWERFRQVVLEDGRIARRTSVEKKGSCSVQ